MEKTVNWAFCCGKIIREDQPCISLNDRGFLFGDAVFTTIKVKEGNLEMFLQHMERLQDHCEKLYIKFPTISEEVIRELIDKNLATKGTWKLKIIITGGDNPSLTLSRKRTGKLFIKMAQVFDEGPQVYSLTVYPQPVFSLTGKLKTLSYLDRLVINDYAISNGYDEAVVTSYEGFIMEAAFSNIFWLIDRHVYVPHSDLNFLMGTMLTFQIEHYKNLGYRIHYVKERLKNIAPNAKFFICNAIKGVVPSIIF